MPVLSAIFKAVDQMSSTFDRMGDAGEEALSRWEQSASGADDALGRAADSAERMSRAGADMSSSADQAGGFLDNQSNSAGSAADQINNLQQQADDLTERLRQLGDEADDAGDDLDDFGDDADAAGDDADDFGNQSTGAVNKLGAALASAGIVVLVKEIAGAFLECSDAAAEFETYLAKVSTIADPTQASLATIRGDIVDLSMDTGKAVAELTDATYQALSAGVETANSVQFAGTATKLAVGGFTEASTAVDVLTTAINAYNLETEQATYISDLLVTTQNLGKTTVNELATSVGKVIPLASAYNVQMDNLSSAYAVMTASGIATAESTTYIKGMLNELGSASSTVGKVLEEETGKSFADLMEDGYSLGDVLDILGESVDGNTTAFSGMWSSVEAGVGALSLFNAGADRYNDVLDDMQQSAGATAAAYDAMTNTTAHGSERMGNSFDNLQIAIGTAVNPAMDALYNLIADVVDGMTKFADENPEVVAAITAAVAVVGIAVVGLAAYTAVTTAASAVTAAFGTTVAAVFWPVTLVVAAVAALAAGIAAIVKAVGDSNAEFDGMTSTSKAQYEQLQELNDEYDRAVELYGENSTQAQALAQDIAGLEAEYEACKTTTEEFVARNDALIESHNNLMESFQSTVGQLDQEEQGTMSLIGKLEELASKTDLTVGEQRQMAAIVDKLNAGMPGLKLKYDSVTGSLNKNAAAVRLVAQEMAEERRQQETMDAYVALLNERADLEEQVARAAEETAAAQERYDSASGFDQFWNIGKVTSDLEDFTAEQERLQAALDETDKTLAEHEAAFDAAAEAAENAAIASDDYEGAVSYAVASVTEDIDTLATAWDDAYKAARDSIDGTIGLFDTMKTETELSVKDMTAALQSQVDYLTTYSENLRLAAQYGLDDGLIASLSDGSAESAGYLDAIIGKIEALGGTTEGLSQDAAAFVENFNGQFAEVNAAKDDFAATVATMESDFDASMDEIEGRMNEAIDKMNLSTDAATAAEATIDAYIASIKGKTGEAHDAAAAVAYAAQAALSGGGGAVAVPGYATGTTNAPDMYIAGEEGPELIVGAAGSTVFPADATEKILGAAEHPIQTSVPPGMGPGDAGPGQNERKIIFEVAGHGSIEVSGNNPDYDAVAEWLEENMRPAIISAIKKEIHEEGDGSYEF